MPQTSLFDVSKGWINSPTSCYGREILPSTTGRRAPVTGISGGWPTRLQVACRVESCRKLASSVKISARFSVRAFF